MSEKTQPHLTLEKLRLAIHGLTAPFFCAGTFVPDKPVALIFKDGVRFEVLRAKTSYEQPKELQVLLNHCQPAPFGEGKKTRYDRNVRDALQLKAEQGAFRVENFDPDSAGVLKQIQAQLLPHDSGPISAELYTVNVYREDGHFAPHKDTPRGSDMFGTLVVCLPSSFYRGKLLLTHRGVVQEFDWGNAIQYQKQPNQLHWAAFFADVDHQIERLWGGARVTLTYLLRRTSGSVVPRETAGEDLAPLVQEAWRAVLADPTCLPEGGVLGYPCCHLYHQDARLQKTAAPVTPDSGPLLKGRDQLVAATALEAKLNVTFMPYMYETCADEVWQLQRFPTQAEKRKLRKRMDADDLRERLPILASSEETDLDVTWIDPPPHESSPSRTAAEDKDPELPSAALLHSCEYSTTGYFGNEGSEIDLYVYAALHVEIPPYGEGVRAVVEPPKPEPVKPAPAKRTRTSRKRKADQE